MNIITKASEDPNWVIRKYKLDDYSLDMGIIIGLGYFTAYQTDKVVVNVLTVPLFRIILTYSFAEQTESAKFPFKALFKLF